VRKPSSVTEARGGGTENPNRGLTPWLTGAGARSAEGTDMGHENAEGMAHVGVRVEPTVRLGSEVEGRAGCHGLYFDGVHLVLETRQAAEEEHNPLRLVRLPK